MKGICIEACGPEAIHKTFGMTTSQGANRIDEKAALLGRKKAAAEKNRTLLAAVLFF